MKVKELITKLLEFDQNLEVTITDGWEAENYHTNSIQIKEFTEGYGNPIKTVDIGIGGCRLLDQYEFERREIDE